MKQTSPNHKNKPINNAAKGALTGVALALILSGLFWVMIPKTNGKSNGTATTSIDQSFVNAAAIGGDFTMTNQFGKTITSTDLKGRYTILFFGFTSCPAICPTELSKITSAYLKLEKPIQDQLNLVFVSLDPNRDTAPVLKNYLELFHPKWMGLRGTNDQTEIIKKAYKVYSAKVPQGSEDDYTIDHSAFIYLMTPDGHLGYMFKNSDKADEINQKIRALIQVK